MKSFPAAEKFFALLFLFSAFVTGVFWTCCSDKRSFGGETEIEIAEIINEKYVSGDMIFPVPEWDIGFTRHLEHGIVGINYSLDAYDEKTISHINNNGTNVIFFILNKPELWNEIKERYSLKEKERFFVGESLVVRAQSVRPPVKKDLDLAGDIMKAEEVFLSVPGASHKKNCVRKPLKWQCSRHSWNYVGVINSVMGGIRQRVVWAHPRSKKRLNIVYPNKSQSTRLLLRTAFRESAYRHKEGSPVEITVKADNEKILEYTNENIKKTYINEVTVPSSAKRIVIQIYTEHDGARHFMYNGFLGR